MLFAIALLPFLATAQLNELLKDPNITWAATFESEHDFRLSSNHEPGAFQLLKVSNPDNGCANFVHDNWLAHWILKEMIAGRYKAYQDPGLSILVTHTTLVNKVSTIDTVITFDPNSYEERIQVIRNDINPDDIPAFRAQQVIYYDKKSGNFKTQLLALAPMVSLTNPSGVVVGKMPLAWLAMEGSTATSLNLQNPDITWAALLNDKANNLEIGKLKVVKDEWKTSIAQQLFVEAKNTKHQVESSKGFGCGKLLSKKDIENIHNAIDTVITFDPVTLVETMQVIKNEFNPAELRKVRLVQEWYFDDRKKVLVTKLKAVAPLMEDFNESRNTKQNAWPMYFIRF